MTPDILLGLIALVVSLTIIIALVLWSRRIIDRIGNKRLESLRDIVRDLRNGN